MKVTLAVAGPGDADVKALVTAIQTVEADAKILYRLRASDGEVHNVLQFVAQHRAEAAIYVGGVVTKKLVEVVAEWARNRWFGREDSGDAVTIYGPNEEVVKVVRRDGRPSE